MKKCDHCGAPNPDNRTVCYSCGESLDTPPTTQVNPNAQPDPNAQAAANTVFDPDAKTVIMPPFTPQMMAPAPSPTQFAGVFKPHWGRVKRKWIAALAAIFAIIAAGGFFHIILKGQQQLKQEKQIAITARQIAWIIENSNANSAFFQHGDESKQKLDILLMQVWNRVADMKTGNAELAHGLSDVYQLEAQAAQQEAQAAQQEAQIAQQDAQDAQQNVQNAQQDAQNAQQDAQQDAQQKAQIAQLDAQTAQIAAQTAQLAQHYAQLDAPAAQQEAQAAQQKAQIAQQKAQIAQQDAQQDVQQKAQHYAQAAQQDAQKAQQEAQQDARIASLMQALATEAQQAANADMYDEQSIQHTERWGKLEQDTLQMLKECH